MVAADGSCCSLFVVHCTSLWCAHSVHPASVSLTAKMPPTHVHSLPGLWHLYWYGKPGIAARSHCWKLCNGSVITWTHSGLDLQNPNFTPALKQQGGGRPRTCVRWCVRVSPFVVRNINPKVFKLMQIPSLCIIATSRTGNRAGLDAIKTLGTRRCIIHCSVLLLNTCPSRHKGSGSNAQEEQENWGAPCLLPTTRLRRAGSLTQPSPDFRSLCYRLRFV